MSNNDSATKANIDSHNNRREFLLQFFAWTYLPPELQAVSSAFQVMAKTIIDTLPRNAERTVALRKLLEAKDCAVRCLLAK